MSKRRSRHPVLKFMATRRLWIATIVLVAFVATGAFRLTTMTHEATHQWPTFVSGVVLFILVLAFGEWINLQLSIERLLRRLAHSEGEDGSDAAGR